MRLVLYLNLQGQVKLPDTLKSDPKFLDSPQLLSSIGRSAFHEC